MNSSQPNEDKDFFPVDLIEISKIWLRKKVDSEEILLAMETAIAKAKEQNTVRSLILELKLTDSQVK